MSTGDAAAGAGVVRRASAWGPVGGTAGLLPDVRWTSVRDAAAEFAVAGRLSACGRRAAAGLFLGIRWTSTGDAAAGAGGVRRASAWGPVGGVAGLLPDIRWTSVRGAAAGLPGAAAERPSG
ncbi:hypothetical protein AB6O49_02955 [Streptomyces sp. SBR177]